MSGDIGDVAGASRRLTERAVIATFAAAPTGSRTAANAFDVTRPGVRRAMPSIRRLVCESESRTSATVPNVSGAGTAGRSSSSSSSPGSRSRSTSSVSSAIPPTPSVIEWWTFIASAARSPSSPSKSVNSHSGRARSNALDAIGWSASSNVGASPGGVRRRWRRWKSRSNVASVAQRGGPMRNGGDRTRWRSRGITRVARSMRARESRPVGRAIEDRDREDRRPEDRVLLDVPHERVFIAHVVRELPRHHRPVLIDDLPALRRVVTASRIVSTLAARPRLRSRTCRVAS